MKLAAETLLIRLDNNETYTKTQLYHEFTDEIKPYGVNLDDILSHLIAKRFLKESGGVFCKTKKGIKKCQKIKRRYH